jgi:hypothetical protein
MQVQVLHRQSKDFMATSPFEFKLRSAEDKTAVELEIMRRIQAAVSDSREQRDDWRAYADQIEGLLGGTGSNTPWQGACELNDTLTMEQFLSAHAALSGAQDRYPPVMVEATNKDDEKSAEMQEAYIPLKLNQGGFDKAKNELIFNALRYPVAIGYAGHRQIVRQRWEEIDVHPETGLKVEEDEQEPGTAYEKGYESFPEVIEDGLESLCIDSPDFYLYPATANDLQAANGCGHRIYLSADDLLAGIKDLDYDEDAVMELIAMGPGRRCEDSEEDRQQLYDRQGVSPPEDGDDLYEVFRWFCKPPLLYEQGEDGKPDFIVPGRYRDRDLEVICCPSSNIVLRMGISTHGHTRPYVPFYCWPVPGSFYGWCIPMLLDSIQTEANANIQHTINCMNMEINPAMKIQDSILQRYENIKFHPGAIIPYFTRPDEVQTFDFPVKSTVGLETQQWLDTKAEKVVAAGGYGTMPSKSRKAAEINATSQAASSKFDAMLRMWNLGLSTYWRQAAAILADNLPEEGEDFLSEEDHPKHITPHMLKGKFLYRPVANGQNADPQARAALAESKNKAADEYLALKGNPQTPPEVLKLKWHNTRAVLIDLGEHSPEGWIGEEPSGEAPPAPVAQPGAPPQGQPGMPGMMPPPQAQPPLQMIGAQ